MMTYHRSADASGTFRETTGLDVSRVSSASKNRDTNDALRGITLIATTRTTIVPLTTVGTIVHLPSADVVTLSDSGGDLLLGQSSGLNCSARTARTSLA